MVLEHEGQRYLLVAQPASRRAALRQAHDTPAAQPPGDVRYADGGSPGLSADGSMSRVAGRGPRAGRRSSSAGPGRGRRRGRQGWPAGSDRGRGSRSRCIRSGRTSGVGVRRSARRCGPTIGARAATSRAGWGRGPRAAAMSRARALGADQPAVLVEPQRGSGDAAAARHLADGHELRHGLTSSLLGLVASLRGPRPAGDRHDRQPDDSEPAHHQASGALR